MTMTVRELALRLAELVNEGHADSVVAIETHQPEALTESTATNLTRVAAGVRWDHGKVLLWPAEVLTRFGNPAEDDAEIGPADIERDVDGFYTHPAHPVDYRSGELANWFASKGLTFTLNYLLEPEDKRDDEHGDFSRWELRMPAGSGWFLFSIRENADNAAVALWVRHKN